MIEFIRLKNYGDNIFKEAYNLYKLSFPIYEQRVWDDQVAAMSEENYVCEAIYNAKNFVGLIFYWIIDDYSYVEHYAICTEFRGDNIGSRALTAFSKRYKKVILEIDIPMDEISIRRERFYLRLGFKQNLYEHFHPPYRMNCKPHKLLLLSYPKIISENNYEEFKKYLKNKIMNYSQLS